VLNKCLTRNPIKIKIPNGATIELTYVAEVDLPMLRPAARKAHIVPALDNCSLLSPPAIALPTVPCWVQHLTRSQHTKCARRRQSHTYWQRRPFYWHVAHHITQLQHFAHKSSCWQAIHCRPGRLCACNAILSVTVHIGESTE
jgi:hypothetical protein